MFDSHCHLTDIENSADAVDDAVSAGVHSMLTCGYNADSNRLVCELVSGLPNLPFALGLHPWFADQDVTPVLALVRRMRPTAIGEAGLDLYGTAPIQPIKRQVEVLEAQLQLAHDLALPVSLHSRNAVQPMLSVLRNHPGVRGVLHAFSGAYEQAKLFLDLGFFIGIGGTVTRDRAKRVRRCAVSLPIDCLLLETDAPAIGVEGVAPPKVRPMHLGRVLEALAQIRGMAPALVEAKTDENAIRMFGPIAAKLARQR